MGNNSDSRRVGTCVCVCGYNRPEIMSGIRRSVAMTRNRGKTLPQSLPSPTNLCMLRTRDKSRPNGVGNETHTYTFVCTGKVWVIRQFFYQSKQIFPGRLLILPFLMPKITGDKYGGYFRFSFSRGKTNVHQFVDRQQIIHLICITRRVPRPRFTVIRVVRDGRVSWGSHGTRIV